MNDSTSTTHTSAEQPTEHARHIADLIAASDTPNVRRYVSLMLAAEDVVANPTEVRLAELADVIAGIHLHTERELAMVRRAAASVRRGGEAR